MLNKELIDILFYGLFIIKIEKLIYIDFENFYLYFLSKNTLFHICLKLDTKNLNKNMEIDIKRNKII